MDNIVGVSFEDKERIKYFLSNDIKTKKNITVVVETENGLRFGKVETDIHKLDQSKLNTKLTPIIRIATKQDYYDYKKNLKDSKEALNKSIELVKKYNLSMNIVSAEFTFDRDQLVFKFLADSRIDFRELARELASLYHTRIELRQIGVRDKAKEIGGLGCCGQKLCCSRFLNDFDSVSISMAKNQNLALNPSKINGVCGRLLCCLKFEDECYKECKKNMPSIGKNYEKDDICGKVISQDVIKGTCRVATEKGVVEVKI